MKVRVLVFLLTASFSTHVFATAQMPEKLLYNGKEYSLQTHPLEKYFKKHPDKKHIQTPWNSGLSRGYIATFEIRNKALFLKDIEVYYSVEEQFKTKSASAEFLDGKPEMKIDWFSGVLIIPDGKRINYVHAGYLSTYEKYILIEIKEGNFVREIKMNHEEYKQFFEEYKETKEYHESLWGEAEGKSDKKFGDVWDKKEDKKRPLSNKPAALN